MKCHKYFCQIFTSEPSGSNFKPLAPARSVYLFHTPPSTTLNSHHQRPNQPTQSHSPDPFEPSLGCSTCRRRRRSRTSRCRSRTPFDCPRRTHRPSHRPRSRSTRRRNRFVRSRPSHRHDPVQHMHQAIIRQYICLGDFCVVEIGVFSPDGHDHGVIAERLHCLAVYEE